MPSPTIQLRSAFLEAQLAGHRRAALEIVIEEGVERGTALESPYLDVMDLVRRAQQLLQVAA